MGFLGYKLKQKIKPLIKLQLSIDFDIVVINIKRGFMKKISILILAFFMLMQVFAFAEEFNYVSDGQQITYDSISDYWTVGGIDEDDMVLYKKLYDGAGSYSQYLDANEKKIFTLKTDVEFVKDGVLYAIDNNEFGYYKIVYDGVGFQEEPLSYGEIQELFPDAEIISLASIDTDNKMWIHKPIGAKKKLLFLNDSDKFFHKLTPNCIEAQDENIKGLITISRYGIYRFKHYGQRDGKLTIYVR